MRGLLFLSVIALLFLLMGCNYWGEEIITLASTPTAVNTLHPASQTIFVEISTRYFGTDSERCDYFFYIDGPWSWEYFSSDHHMVIHYLEPGRSILAARALVGYARSWSGSIGSGYATDVYDIVEDFPYGVDVLEDARIVTVDANGSILIEIAGQEYTLGPGESWSTSENTIFDEQFNPFHGLRETDYETANCHMQITYSVTNHGLISLNRIWIDEQNRVD